MKNLILPIALFLTGIFSCAVSFFFIYFRNRQDILPKLDKIPRAKYAGIMLSALVFLWCVPHINAIFDSEPGFRKIIYPVLFAVWVLCFIFLDYLFARAFGALCIFICYTFLYQIFYAHISGAWFTSAACYLLGVYGIVICAKPYYLRDELRFSIMKNWFRWSSLALHLFFASAMFFAGIQILLKIH